MPGRGTVNPFHSFTLAPQEPQQSTQTLADLLDVYERDFLPLQAPTTAYKKHCLYRHYRANFGHLLLTEITPAWLRVLRDQLALGHKPGTVRVYMDALSAALTVAVKNLDWLDEHPMRKVQKLPDLERRVRFLSTEECTRLLRACRRSNESRLYPVALLALCTGARKTELLTLRRSDLDLEDGYIHIRKTKNGHPRTVPLTGAALEHLSKPIFRIMPPDAWLFPGPRRGRPTRIDYAWDKARKAAGLSDVRLHDLRHTAASYLAMSGATLLEIGEILGHRTMQMVKRYAHFTREHTRNVAERMTQQYLPGRSDR